ncbi:hypothetical protein [Streptomyces sp. NPDC001070]
MITRPGLPKSEVWLWLWLGGTVHDVAAGHLLIEGLRGVRQEWARWTAARHLQQAAPVAQLRPAAVQTCLFSGLTAVQADPPAAFPPSTSPPKGRHTQPGARARTPTRRSVSAICPPATTSTSGPTASTCAYV